MAVPAAPHFIVVVRWKAAVVPAGSALPAAPARKNSAFFIRSFLPSPIQMRGMCVCGGAVPPRHPRSASSCAGTQLRRGPRPPRPPPSAGRRRSVRCSGQDGSGRVAPGVEARQTGPPSLSSSRETRPQGRGGASGPCPGNLLCCGFRGFNCSELVWGPPDPPPACLLPCRGVALAGGRFIVWSLSYICPGHRGWFVPFLMSKQKQEMLKVSCDVIRPNICPPSGPVGWDRPSMFWAGW